ncbi:hypothetical protein [Comamonas antarctica]|uniref:Uncharacterized protein n=1 Tax=Comamonas antarctica TaxID=2743470 RepID=A0A6N1WYU1_9BURK|nr:hypothetical protein [Comamonas antarctica]QKV52187.1 hypothetical protein HUK68_04325 [Comamonas antarctica]
MAANTLTRHKPVPERKSRPFLPQPAFGSFAHPILQMAALHARPAFWRRGKNRRFQIFTRFSWPKKNTGNCLCPH